MSAVTDLLARPALYRAWMAPFAESKFAPILQYNDLSKVRRVLDVGCGPGTNAPHFDGTDYTGIDLNESYIADARRRHRGRFIAADATSFTVEEGDRFDFVLINSFLHHLPDDAVVRLLDHLSSVLSPEGHVHVMELELPDRRSIARLLARMDRGDHARPRAGWRELLCASFDPIVFEPYPVGGPGGVPTLWNMVYFKGRTRGR